MSIRTLLDVRYTFPGITFLLFSFGVAFPYLNQWLPGVNESTQAFVIGMVTVIGGAPLGYYVSQAWYQLIIWNICGVGLYGDINKKRKYIDFLHKEKVKDDRYITVQVLDFLFNYYDNENIKEYVRKRWNMYNIMGSTISGIIIGLIFGIFFRNHVEYYSKISFTVHEGTVVGIGIVLIILFKMGMLILRKEHENMVFTIVHNVTKDELYWKDKFPKEFFN